VGYELDAEHYASSSERSAVSSDSAMDVDGEGNGQEKEKTKLVYLLPAGIMSTEVMASGKKIGEKEAALGEGERHVVVAVWE